MLFVETKLVPWNDGTSGLLVRNQSDLTLLSDPGNASLLPMRVTDI